MNKYLSLLFLGLCVGAVQARSLIVENKTDRDLRVRVKVKLVGDKAFKKGSIIIVDDKKAEKLAAGASKTIDLTQAKKWVRSTTKLDQKKLLKGKRKGEKESREFIAPALGTISSVELVKVKAKSLKTKPEDVKVKGKAKIQRKREDGTIEILREDLTASSHIAIEQADGELVFKSIA